MMRMRGGYREGSGRPMGAKNKRTVAVEQAMALVADKLKAAVPDAFEGDGVAYLQSVYRDPQFSVELRMDAASKAARYERPALGAVMTKDVTPASATPAEIDSRIAALLRKGMAGAALIDG